MAECTKFKIAREFLKKHDWPVSLCNPKYDRCFCKFCYTAEQKDTDCVGGNKYVVPRGWTRLGVHVDEILAKHHQIWDTWSICYHGTSIKSAKSIIEHRQLLLPGEETLDGETITIPKGENLFFTTPTIKYAEHRAYASGYIFTASDKKQYHIKVVLQCKQKPDSFKVQGQTVGVTKPICRYIPNGEVEWVSRKRACIMPYGLLLGIEPVDV